jgi:phage tail sheath protein FI
LETTNNACYQLVKKKIREMPLLLPASGAVAGVYAMIDNTRGVWKAPANVNIALAKKPSITITDKAQEALNIDPAGGKSINAIRSFAGRGAATIWGARTLAGNHPEWRYISVTRFFIMVEGSVELAVKQFIFEPNEPATWVKVKALVENFANTLWRMGALEGVTPKEAYFVHIGLGATMTALDIQEGRMIVEIGMAVSRPAEFIVLRLMFKMLPET